MQATKIDEAECCSPEMICPAADDDDSNSDDDDELDLFGEMTEEEKEAKAKKDAVSICALPTTRLCICSQQLGHLQKHRSSASFIRLHQARGDSVAAKWT